MSRAEACRRFGSLSFAMAACMTCFEIWPRTSRSALGECLLSRCFFVAQQLRCWWLLSVYQKSKSPRFGPRLRIRLLRGRRARLKIRGGDQQVVSLRIEPHSFRAELGFDGFDERHFFG